jgi:hypothetical protein
LECIDCLTETLYSNIHINASYLAINDEQDISEIFYDAVDQNEEDAGYIIWAQTNGISKPYFIITGRFLAHCAAVILE